MHISDNQLIDKWNLNDWRFTVVNNFRFPFVMPILVKSVFKCYKFQMDLFPLHLHQVVIDYIIFSNEMTQSFKITIFTQRRNKIFVELSQCTKKWNHTQILKKVQTDGSCKNMQIMILYA